MNPNILLQYKKITDKIIIIGGGESIKEGISLGLRFVIRNNFVIVCNYAYKHFLHNILVCVDKDFYVPQFMKSSHKKPDIYEELKNESLIITTANISKQVLLPNTLLVKGSGLYNTNPLEKGFYHPCLCGIFALHLAEFLEPEEIFLLGFDWTGRRRLNEPPTNYKKIKLESHYYTKKEINHDGVGKLSFYKTHNPNNYFKVFNDSKSKIYNVSLKSNIDNFEKISYQQMFTLLSK